MSIRPRIAAALAAASDTRAFVVGPDVLRHVPELYERHLDERPVRLVADPNTFAAAGRKVLGHLSAARVPCLPPFILPSRSPHADDVTLAAVREALAGDDALAVAVGSGTVNDLCKRASHELRRPYLVVATAASVDGYASFGAPISQQGFKKTMPCNAPKVIVADTGVLAKAPAPMTAAGYADLAAKVTGGSDWIIADAVGADPILPNIWDMIQRPLRGWLAEPARLAANDPARLEDLFEGLTLTGFAMQATQSSRPASGAEHLFSHVWEMTGLAAPDGTEPSHGFKVGIGTLATTALTEGLFASEFTVGQVDQAVANYPDWPTREAFIRELFQAGPLLDRILEESQAKQLTPEALRSRLLALAQGWDKLRHRVLGQLIPFADLVAMLRAAGCPTRPEEIGLTRPRLSATAFAAQMIRSRYTVLDLAFETGRLPELASQLGNAWSRVSTP